MTLTNSLSGNERSLLGECSIDGKEIGVEDDDSAQMDVQIWEPPEPENHDDVVEEAFADCIDNDDGSSEWGYLDCYDESEDESSKKKKVREENQRAMLEEADSKFKSIVSQLVKSAGFEGEENWVEIVGRLCWEAASLLKPTIDGKPVDPTAYIKIKCIATGSCNQSQVFKGLVFKKHAAHKHMATKFDRPRIMLVEGALGQSLSGFYSFLSTDQEEDYMEPVADVIEAYKPDVMLVESSVSRDVQFGILEKGVTLVFDMNLHRLKRISRCIGSPIISFNSLSSQKLGQCDSFHIEKIVEEHNAKNPTKTLMFLEGGPTSLGCTILLKGSHSDRLKKVKKVAQDSVILAYYLMLEAFFLADRKTMFSTIFTKESTDVTPENSSCAAESDGDPYGFLTGFSYLSAKLSKPLLLDPELPVNTNSDDGDMSQTIETGLESQSTLVLVSKRNALRGIMCDQSHFSHIKFYEHFDVPLERFLRDLFNQENQCQTCEEYPEAHDYYYAHKKKQLTIQIKRIPTTKCLSGEGEGKIWMWSCCGKCKKTKKGTKRVVISAAARSLSFGNLLELSFSQQTGLSSCGHSFDSDFLHFFGLGTMVAMLSYSQVISYEVSLPPVKIEKAGWLEKEFQRVFSRGISLFEDAANFLKRN